MEKSFVIKEMPMETMQDTVFASTLRTTDILSTVDMKTGTFQRINLLICNRNLKNINVFSSRNFIS